MQSPKPRIIQKRFPATLSFEVDIQEISESEGEGGRSFQVTPKIVRNDREAALCVVLEDGEALVFVVKMGEEFKCDIALKMAAHPDVVAQGES